MIDKKTGNMLTSLCLFLLGMGFIAAYNMTNPFLLFLGMLFLAGGLLGIFHD